jgi:hypothetical protein
MKKTGVIFFLLGSFLSAFASNIEPKDSIPEKNKSIFYLGVVTNYGYLKVKPPKPDPTRIQCHKNFFTRTGVSIIGIQARLIKSIKRLYLGGSINCDFLYFSKFSEVHDTDSLPNDFRSDNIYSYTEFMITPSLYCSFPFKFQGLEFRPYFQPGIIFEGYINRNKYVRYTYLTYSEHSTIYSGGLFNFSFRLNSGLEIVIKRFISGLSYSYYHIGRRFHVAKPNMSIAGLHVGYQF